MGRAGRTEMRERLEKKFPRRSALTRLRGPRTDDGCSEVNGVFVCGTDFHASSRLSGLVTPAANHQAATEEAQRFARFVNRKESDAMKSFCTKGMVLFLS